MIEKISFLKNRNRDQKCKVCQQVRDQKVWKKLKMELSDHRTKG